ncbi:serine/threonine-protein kinase [Paractinoplanes atraurantiacus]|uniref:non-specific serine/threonine protein kinase n=1 Tax=Paractinoplanes atraurantiacus TaxID=1036182 RepID=A0A285JV15_9ACTN|nr:serine/threonine-protein kinase [Actinoplanes atraurantiacus]SNY64149.1 serine/threonine protein kinase [Actinoplanes atraurantiacus]
MPLLAGRYRLGEALGQGGSSVVHYGFDTTLKRPVAIKIFDESATDVLREARTAAGLSHPNIAQVYDYGEVVDGTDRTPYLVMEFVDGETLSDRIARSGALRWRQAAEIGKETASALAAAHAQELVHRDVNPRNIMLTSEGVKVLDFGIAIAAGHNSIDISGALWGSPSHLAPEQLRGEPSYPSADVYALGLLLFECLTGARAWPGASLVEVLATRHGRPAPRLPRISGLPRDIIRLYEACTAEDPSARPTALEIEEIFRGFAPTPLTRPASHIPPIRSAAHPAPLTVATSPSSRSPRRSRRRVTVVASAAAVAIILSIVGVQLVNGTGTPGGKTAEAAVEGTPAPPTTPAKTTSPAPSSSPTFEPAEETTETTRSEVRRKNTTHTKAPAAKPTKTKSPSATPSASPSSEPETSEPSTEPTPTKTTDDPEPPVEPTDDPTEPTDPPTTEDTTPPTTKPAEPVDNKTVA